MESIGAILQRIKANLASSTPSQTALDSDADMALPCAVCLGRGFVTPPLRDGEIVPHGLVPCPTCTPPTQDYFASLEVSEGNKRAMELCKLMASDPTGWLVLQGLRGTGKTTLACAVISTWLRKPAVPMTATELLDYWRSRYDAGDFQPAFQASCDSPAFIVDDLGAERPTEWAVERLAEFLNHRYGRRLPTLITTNCNEVDMAKQVGTRIADRVFDQKTGFVRVVTLALPSFRTGRTW